MSKFITTDTMLWLNGTWAGLLVENGGNVLEYASTATFQPLDWFLTKQMLKRWWGITKRSELLERIGVLTQTDTGSALRIGYNRAVAQREVWSLPDDAFYEKLKTMKLTYLEWDDLCAVHDMSQQVDMSTVIGYDFARAIMLCEYGYSCGYLKLDESVDMAIESGKKLQAYFSSWDEMNKSYKVGYLFWLLVANQDCKAGWSRRVEALEKAQAVQNGPYSLDWNMPLHR